MNQVFEPVDLRTEDAVELTEKINEFISRIRKNNEIGVGEANNLVRDVAWITENYRPVIGMDKRKTLRRGSQNVVLGLDSTKAVLLLQVIRETIKPLTEKGEKEGSVNE